MKNVFFAGIMTLLAIGCNQDEKKENASSGNDAEVTALYEKNLSTLKAFVAAFEKEDIDGDAALVADTAFWNSPAYGDTVHTKKHWMESLKYYMDNWNNLHLTNGQFLPGVDSATHEFDGSVRYYGRWDGVHTSGLSTQVNFYGTYEFDKDNKIIFGADFFDLGGLMNAVQPKGK
jgi:limonene-1,2-epoxide hydrolase